jgi:hypothetical protein
MRSAVEGQPVKTNLGPPQPPRLLRLLPVLLALAGSTVAFWASSFFFIWFSLGVRSMTDGGWLLLGVFLAWLIGCATFCSAVIAIAAHWPGFDYIQGAAALGMALAILLLALDNADLHADGNRTDFHFFYRIWGATALLFLLAAVLARLINWFRSRRTQVPSGT